VPLMQSATAAIALLWSVVYFLLYRSLGLSPRKVRHFLQAADPHLTARTVLAPAEVAFAEAVSNKASRLAIVCDAYTRWSFGYAGLREEAELRYQAQSAVSAEASETGLAALRRLVQSSTVDAVVLAPQANADAVGRVLAESGGPWRCAAEVHGYRLLLR